MTNRTNRNSYYDILEKKLYQYQHFKNFEESIKEETSSLSKLLIQQNQIQYNLIQLIKLKKFHNYLFTMIGLKEFYIVKLRKHRKENFEIIINQFKDEIDQIKIEKMMESETLGKLQEKFNILFTVDRKINKSIDEYKKNRNDLIHELFSKKFYNIQQVYFIAENTLKTGKKLIEFLKYLHNHLNKDTESIIEILSSNSKKT